MAFNGTEGEYISMDDAGALTEGWRTGGNGSIKGYFYGKEKLQHLLDEDGSEGIRIYFGETDKGEKTLVLVAADSYENDIITGTETKILDKGIACPPNCGTGNGLNGNG